jgi:hypothetical protein
MATKIKYRPEEAAALTTINSQEATDFEAAETEPEKSVMLDDRTEEARLADIRRANEDRLVTLAREIESGKPALIHPIVVTDLDFVLRYAKQLENKIALYEKRAGVS